MTRSCRRSWRPVVVVCCACVLAVLGVVVLRFTGLPSILRSDERLCGDRYSSDELHRIMNSTAVKDEQGWFATCQIRFSEGSPFSFLDIDESTRGEILLHGQPAPLPRTRSFPRTEFAGKSSAWSWTASTARSCSGPTITLTEHRASSGSNRTVTSSGCPLTRSTHRTATPKPGTWR